MDRHPEVVELPDESSTPDHALAVFHHEAATPVALIGATLRQMARVEEVPEGFDELLAAALRQVDVLQRVLDQLRVADQDELDLRLEDLDLVALIHEIRNDLAATLLAQHRCHVDAPESPVVLRADVARVRQVLTNLLDNAASYSPAGTDIHVHVDDRGDEVVLAVTDQGTGIADPDLLRIFSRYERASDESPGLGLGLYVVWRIVQAHGGEVRAEPAPEGPGARFVVRFPRSAG